MSLKNNKKEDRLPRIFCVFAAFFAIAIPAFAICVGRATHATWVELATRLEMLDGANPFALWLLENHKSLLWVLFAIAVLAASSLLLLARKNTLAGTLAGTGRIVLALGIASMAAVFYLAMLTASAAFLIVPVLIQ